MASLARGEASNCSNPELDLYTKVNGTLVSVYLVEFEIYDLTGMTPVKVFPVSGRQALTMSPCPTGHAIDTGRYVAEYTPPLTAVIGTHEIRWYFRLLNTSPETTHREEFEVLAEVVGDSGDGYCTVLDMRNEGVTVEQADDGELQAAIIRASKEIDSITGQWFKPKNMIMKLDGRGGNSVHLNVPIIAVNSVKLVSGTSGELSDAPPFVVYNRHIGGMTSPDDRSNPKIELLRINRKVAKNGWPRGTQNIVIDGTFGYTDPDGSPTGKTPDLICHACKLLTLKYLTPITDSSYGDASITNRIIEEKTRDQSYKLTSTRARSEVGWYTGDPQIDKILAMYLRPIGVKFV